MSELIDFHGLPGMQFPDAKICAQGAQLLKFRDWLWVSSAARFEFFQPIRGGIPIVFPWFGAKNGAAQHGFARTSMWELDESSLSATLCNADLPDPQMWVPFELRLEYQPRSSSRLSVVLSVENRSSGFFDFEILLHSYFAVSDVRAIEIEGLEGAHGFDKNNGNARRVQSGALKLEAATDLVFENASGPLAIRDTHRTIEMRAQTGWNSTVVWNPFRSLPDVPEDEWARFVCVEVGSVGASKIGLDSGKTFEMALEIVVS